MHSQQLPANARFVARLAGVREVSLYGTADLERWRQHLAPLGLRPAAVDGAAQLVLSASALRWYGRAFREIILTVALAPDGGAPDAFFLAGGFNTSRLLAWSERRLFRTPYRHAEIEVDSANPRFGLRHAGHPVVDAQLGQPRAAATHRDEPWTGPVFLPPRRAAAAPEYMVVALSGAQASYPFEPGRDRFEVAPAADQTALRWLAATGFAPTEWRVRASATHARSGTYRQDAAPA